MHNTLSQVRARNFFVGSVDASGNVSLASKPYFHGDYTSAQKESIRLAANHPGKAFFVARMQGGSFLPAPVSVQTL